MAKRAIQWTNDTAMSINFDFERNYLLMSQNVSLNVCSQCFSIESRCRPLCMNFFQVEYLHPFFF